MLIGLTGPSGAGKTVAAKHLERRHGFARLHAGAPVKEGVAHGFGLTPRDMSAKGKDEPSERLGGAAPRAVMEAYGAALHAVAPRATAHELHRRVVETIAGGESAGLPRALARGKSLVVDGVRSQAEADAIKAMGGEIWRIDDGSEADPELPMDRRQALIPADRKIDARGGKGAVRAAIDAEMLRPRAAGKDAK